MTLPLLGAGLMAGSSVLGGIASGNAANYQAQVASNNAQIARGYARYSAGAGATQIEEAGLKDRQQTAGVRAAAAANGVDVNSGSAADLQVSQRELGGLDQATTASRAAEAVYGYEAQAQSYGAQSKLDRSEALGDVVGGLLKGGGQLAGASPNIPEFTSLASGEPSVPQTYQWMQYAGPDAASPEDLG